MKESPIFTRTYDLLRRLIPVTIKFPRQQRFVLAEAIQRTALTWQEQFAQRGRMAKKIFSPALPEKSAANHRRFNGAFCALPWQASPARQSLARPFGSGYNQVVIGATRPERCSAVRRP
jgi:hypothetical protein